MGSINAWNANIDRTKTVMRWGRNGVLYEYLIPHGGNPMAYYFDAIDVKSHKSPHTTYQNGKRPGEYQPVGDKRFFTYYQMKKMKERGVGDDYVEIIEQILKMFYEGGV